MMESDNLRSRAEAIFKKKAVALREGERAMEDYKSAQRAMQEKTARLKALRLARDATQKKMGVFGKTRVPGQGWHELVRAQALRAAALAAKGSMP
jgi:hypothetical protein